MAAVGVQPVLHGTGQAAGSPVPSPALGESLPPAPRLGAGVPGSTAADRQRLHSPLLKSLLLIKLRKVGDSRPASGGYPKFHQDAS